MRQTWFLRTMTVGLVLIGTGVASAQSPWRWWRPEARQNAQRNEARLQKIVSNDRLRETHEALASEPHVAGTDGDIRVAEWLRNEFEALGLEVEMHEIWVYLAYPKGASVRIEGEDESLPVREAGLDEDAYSQDERLDIGWNAYSGSGEVTGEVVYANYGRKEDFEKLVSMGVALDGKIVLARYGGNYRGFKAKFAEQFGAAGLIIYTDPGDSGYVKGLPYPEGGFANDTYIQRGSINTSSVEGDPLTPFAPATKDAERIDPSEADLPTIPVQPVGPVAARRIMQQMRGDRVPGGWQGGLPLAYRVTGGPDLRVTVKVEQERAITKTYNVVGTLRGTEAPEELVIIGCHHDAWGFGASDPMAGMMCLVESARCFAEAAERGMKPKRSIAFAAWAAEEYGLIGSSEWVEAHRETLSEHAIAYINTDMAAMGPKFRSSSAPSLKSAISATAQTVTAIPLNDAGKRQSVHDAWLARAEDPLVPGQPRFSDLGGGSDHVGFYCHLGVPSCGVAAGGARGTSYHSNYDTLAWYQQIVGNDYESARVVTQMITGSAYRLAYADLIALDPVRYGTDVGRHLENISERGAELDVLELPEEGEIAIELLQLAAVARQYEQRAARVMDRLHASLDGDSLPRAARREINGILKGMERAWVAESGIPRRAWFRSLYAATDEDSGYAQWMLPGLRALVEDGSSDELIAMEQTYRGVFGRLTRAVNRIDALVPETSGDRRDN